MPPLPARRRHTAAPAARRCHNASHHHIAGLTSNACRYSRSAAHGTTYVAGSTTRRRNRAAPNIPFPPPLLPFSCTRRSRLPATRRCRNGAAYHICPLYFHDSHIILRTACARCWIFFCAYILRLRRRAVSRMRPFVERRRISTRGEPLNALPPAARHIVR